MPKDDPSQTAGEPDDTVSEANSVVEDRSERIREAARRVGSNRALAGKSGVPISTLNSYLAGQEPKLSSLLAIAEASGLSFEWLATGRLSGTGVSPYGAAPFRMFASIDIDQLAAAMLQAERAFQANRGAPTARERAQAIALIYDMLSAQSEGLGNRGK